MARWFIARSPEELKNEGELTAYQSLKSLDDSWTILWCYDYLDGKIEKEGDFLILGPDRRLLVLEVKTRARVFTDSTEAGKKAFLRATSFNKSKGLDARAVVLIGSPRWDDLQSDMRQPYWIAASRARQMLAVISIT